MFFKKATLLVSVFTAVNAAAVTRDSTFNGTATLGFYDVVNCFCPPWNGPLAVAIPTALAGDATCCDDQITLTYGGETTTAVFSGFYDSAGAEDIALSPVAFGAVAGHPWDTSLAEVAWSFL